MHTHARTNVFTSTLSIKKIVKHIPCFKKDHMMLLRKGSSFLVAYTTLVNHVTFASETGNEKNANKKNASEGKVYQSVCMCV